PGRCLHVAVLLSGGVDSSLALQLLVAAGHHCKAFYLQIWFQEDFRNFWDTCPWEEDLSYAQQQVCDSLGVDLEVVPMTSAYWDRVVSHSVSEIRAGRTPNPDVMCNTHVKFGAFFDYLDAQQGQPTARLHDYPFDRVASGHYARVLRSPTAAAPAEPATPAATPCQAALLCLTPDAVKDQTYFLAHLSPSQLSRALFPLGALTKAQVRQLAAVAGLATQARKDSQGICFLGKVKFPEFVQEHLGVWPGLIVLARFGGQQVLGVHQGYWFYTLGQRGGIRLPGGPWYVVRKDCDLNIVYVSRQYQASAASRSAFVTGPFSWLSHLRPRQPIGTVESPRCAPPPLYCKVRHGPHAYRCELREVPGASGQADFAQGALVVLDGCDQGLAAGQYAVLYQEGVCLGSAVIQGPADTSVQGYAGPDATGQPVVLHACQI
ncbi:tRNA-specific 2-thiouridylase, partial [Haematococcus lacustris]